MSVKIEEKKGANLLNVVITGQLSSADYEAFTPMIERLINKYGKVRMLVEMRDFHGWDAGALWEDIKFDVKHYSDIEKLALVGESKWEKGMSAFCRPFTSAAIRYFNISNIAEAREWISADCKE